MRRTALAVSAFAAALLARDPVPATAQGLDAGAGAAGGSAIGFEHYRFATGDAANIESLSLLTVPVGGRVPLFGRASLDVRSAWARAAMTRPDGSEISLAGFTDTEIGVGVSFGPANFVTTVTGVAVVPTGHSSHTLAESELVGVIAADLLPLRISHWGAGGGGGARFSTVRAFEWGSLGFGAGYVVTREFEPLQADAIGSRFEYRPGDQLQLRAALDRTIGRSAKWTTSLALQIHRDDQLDGSNLYRAGNRYQAMTSYAFAAGAGSSGIVYLGGLHRDRGTALLDFSRDIPAQTLVLAGGGLRIPAAGTVLLPSVDTRLFRTADGVGQGFLSGVGVSLEWPLQGAVVVPSARARFGTVLVRQGRDSGIVGADLGLGIRFGSPR
jgi:hypothetical protein